MPNMTIGKLFVAAGLALAILSTVAVLAPVWLGVGVALGFTGVLIG